MRRPTFLMIAVAGLALATGLQAAPASPGTASAPAASNAPAGSFSGAFLAARSAEVDGDLESAAAYYRRALVFRPDDEIARQSLMLMLVSQGDFEEALPLARELDAAGPLERFARLAVAIDAIRRSAHDEALDALDFEPGTDLDHLIVNVMSAWTEAAEDRLDDALARLDGLDGPEWFALFTGYHSALIAASAGLDDSARAAFEETVANVDAGAAAPETYLRAVEAYARFQAAAGETQAALETLEQADQLAPERVTAQALRADIEAGREIRPVVADLRSGASEILVNLAGALGRGGGDNFVRLYLQYALALTPGKDTALLQLGGLAEQQRDGQAAIDFYSRIDETSPLRGLSDLQVGLNLADLDRHEEAIAHLEPLLEADPDDRRAYLALGSIYASQQDFASSAQLYDRAVARIDEPDPADWNLYYQRAIAYERLKEWEKAEPDFKTALELFPNHPQVLNYLGYSWVDRNMNLDEALDLIKTAVELRPSDGYIVDSLGWAYYKLGRYEDAVRELERAVNLMPADPILNDHLGDAYWQVDRRLEARFQWNHARDLEPEAELLAEIEEKLANGLVEREASAEPETLVASVADPAVPVAQGETTGASGEVQREEAAESAELGASPSLTTAPEERVYRVRAGQSLWTIARDELGDGAMFSEILRLNPQLGNDPNRLQTGQELRMPGPAE